MMVDIYLFCTIILCMNNIRLSSCERRPAPRIKHVPLTGWLRHKYLRTPRMLREIIEKCDVDPCIGALPPQLLARLNPADITLVTMRFREALQDFLVDNGRALRTENKNRVFDLPEVGAMFGSGCQIYYRGTMGPDGDTAWRGAFGIVCKLSFPDIRCDYALKFYYSDNVSGYGRHGPWYEIPTAFAACNAEPHHNNPVYMASLFHNMYMLSAWGGDDNDGWMRRNRYELFYTRPREVSERNYRNGCRIDWGDTSPTAYAAISYRGRKLYRKIDNAWRRGGLDALKQIIDTKHPLIGQRDYADGLRLFYYQYYEFLPPETNAVLKEALDRCR